MGWRLRFGVARGDDVAQFLEVAVVEFGIVRRRIVLRWISRITVFGEEIAVGNFGFDGSVVGNEGAVDVAGAFEGPLTSTPKRPGPDDCRASVTRAAPA